ncbi:MAG: hypothetical protein KAJ14_00025 [Candidatus Omnitrophica bacterium]|nr:hypothetical protein [Candidatus Omnitrophota bacterium]MCK5491482.1 hypothetical protein [Candidatus Omnitrophota bacterium]
MPSKTIIRNSQNKAFKGKTEKISVRGIRFIINQKLAISYIIDIEISGIENTLIKCKAKIK